MEENFDLSGAIEKLQQMLSTEEGQNDLKTLVGQFTSEEQPAMPDGNTPAPSGEIPDLSRPETVQKLSSILAALQSQPDSPDVLFLNALRPYLKESRRHRLDQAIKFLGMARVLKLMQESGGKGGLL